MKTLKYLILGLLIPLFSTAAERTFFSDTPIPPIRETIINNYLDDSLQIHSPIDFNYLNELAAEGSIYLIIKSNKLINIPDNEQNTKELSNLNLLEGQSVFSTEYNPVILFHNIKYLNKSDANNTFPVYKDLCVWPNIACQMSRAIIGFLPITLKQSYEVDDNKVIPVNKVNLIYDNKDIRSFDMDFNKLYGYEIVKNEKVSNYYVSQFLELNLESDFLKELKIHFFSRTSYEDQGIVAELITTEIHKTQDPSFTPSISPFLLELQEQNIYLCRTRR